MYTHKILVDGEVVSLVESAEQAYRIRDMYKAAYPNLFVQVRKRLWKRRGKRNVNKNTKA